LSSLAGTGGATTGATFGTLATRAVAGFFLIAVAARRFGAGFAFGLGLAARAGFLAGLRAAAGFFRAVRVTTFFVVRRLAALARAFLGLAAFRDFAAVRFLEAAGRDFFIGSPLLG
jgi:hypothetical protein